jgi:hypothetical protein
VRKLTSRLVGAALEGALISLIVLALIAVPALAAKGGKGGGGKPSAGGGTISLVVLDGTDAVANYMERVAFDVSTTATDRPFVGVRCWQASDFVMDAYTGYFEDYMFDPWVTLGSTYWNAEASANCTARLFYYNKRGGQNVLATLDFVAEP